MLSIKKFGAATLVSGRVFLLDPGSAEAVTIKLDGIGEEAPEPLSDEVASQVNPADIKGYILPRMLKVYPQLKDVRIDFQWGAMIGIVPNRIPVVGRIDDKGAEDRIIFIFDYVRPSELARAGQTAARFAPRLEQYLKANQFVRSIGAVLRKVVTALSKTSTNSSSERVTLAIDSFLSCNAFRVRSKLLWRSSLSIPA